MLKLKRRPSDFRVEEIISLEASGGPFALYRLTKQSLGTHEAVHAIIKQSRVRPNQVAFAGLKDKHARTTQYVTIHGGRQRSFSQSHLKLQYVGQAARPIHASDIVANRFAIVLRNLAAAEIESLVANCEAVRRDGMPNYFDDQRFGSLGESGEFIAKPWCLGDYERAIWLALADENKHDRPADHEQKRLLREHWGDWRYCRDALKRSPWSPILSHLAANPNDFRRAIGLVPHELRSLWLAAFQSHLWNQVLGKLISQLCPPEHVALQKIGGHHVPLFMTLNSEQREFLHGTKLPLPSARLHLEDSSLALLYADVLAREGLEMRQVRTKYPRDSFFSKGERSAALDIADLQHETAEDELYPSRQRLTLRFTLPRGSYATILVKRIQIQVRHARGEQQ